MPSPLKHIQYRQRSKFTGHLHFERFLLYMDKGMLCTAEAEDDNFWILRRLLCRGFIDDDYAQELQKEVEELNLYLFPNLPETEWRRIVKDRSRQNLMSILGQTQEPIATSCFVDRLPFLHEVNLEKFDKMRQCITPLQERIAHIWIKSKDVQTAVKAHIIPLAVLVAQSPWEELDILQSVYELIELDQLEWGENVAELEGSILEEEELLFSKGEETEKGGYFVVPQNLLEHVQLEEDEP